MKYLNSAKRSRPRIKDEPTDAVRQITKVPWRNLANFSVAFCLGLKKVLLFQV